MNAQRDLKPKSTKRVDDAMQNMGKYMLEKKTFDIIARFLRNE